MWYYPDKQAINLDHVEFFELRQESGLEAPNWRIDFYMKSKAFVESEYLEEIEAHREFEEIKERLKFPLFRTI